jgi:hypothetical protein
MAHLEMENKGIAAWIAIASSLQITAIKAASPLFAL